MNKIVNLLKTWEKQWGCEFLPYDFSLRNKTNKQTNKKPKEFTNLNRFMREKRVTESEVKRKI